MSTIHARITGTGSFVPSRVLTNQDLERMVDTSDEWIVERTGIRERRISSADQAASDLAYEACVKALEDAGLEAREIDAVLVGTVTGDHAFPSTGCILQDRLGAKNAFAYDFGAACSGFLYGLLQAQAFVRSGTCQRVLVIGVELLSKVVDWTDRNTCVLFGDGAGAAVIEAGAPGILALRVRSDGALADIISLPAGGSRMPITPELIAERKNRIQMKGNETFKVAVKAMESVLLEVVQEAGIRQSDIDLLIPHQANMRIIQALGKRLEVPEDRVYINVDRYGNTSAATIPIAIDEARRIGRVGPGSLLVVASFGSGVTWGAAVVRL